MTAKNDAVDCDVDQHAAAISCCPLIAAPRFLDPVTGTGSDAPEPGFTGLASSLYALVSAFERAGIEFLDADNGGAGVRFKRR